MVRNIKKMKASPKAKNMNVAFWNKTPSEVRKGHQDTAEKGGYGKQFKDIGDARKKKDKLIQDFLNN
tara:strand:+ start:263 stop:463 length:201 start_codon:yes stop_codon:yes gene_type:complete